ncbi:hypothetical protein QR685DRAFT_572825 [Neurospora intermedia]|uniref:Uncharacterized protein n=1 Tax=Neurospora intermedia TaxID=5142 RepID=A0ABR3DBE4_NEUIN
MSESNLDGKYFDEMRDQMHQFGQALEPDSQRYLGASTPALTPAVPGIPAGSRPEANPAAPAAVPLAAAPATISARQQNRRIFFNLRRKRTMLWRLYNSSRTTSAGTEIPRPRWEGFVRGPNNVRQILPIDDNKDPQQNSGEASGTQDGTSGNSSDERATRSFNNSEQ